MSALRHVNALIILLLFASHSLCAAEEFFPRKIEYYQIFSRTLILVGERPQFRYGIETPADIRNIENDWSRAADAVETLGLASKYPHYDYDRFVEFTLPYFFRHEKKYELFPTREQIERTMKSNPAAFPTREFFFGWEIHVRPQPGVKEPQLQALLDSIAAQLRNEPFQLVAYRHYQTVGAESDGSLGNVSRGDVPDWKFDAFMNAPEKSDFFGPVKGPDGFLFGKFHDRMTSQTDPVDHHRERVINSMLGQRYVDIIERYYATRRAETKLEVFSHDRASSLGLDQIAYRIGNHGQTFRQVLARLPQYSGDPNDPRFHDAMAKHAWRDDLILTDPKAKEMEQSPEFQRLASAHRNTWLIEQYVESKMAAVDASDAALEMFYNGKPGEISPVSDKVSLLIVKRKRDASADKDPARRADPAKPDFVAAKLLRQLWLADPTREGADKLAALDPKVTIEEIKEPRALDTLGRILEMGLEKLQAGEISEPLVGDQDYLLVKVLTRESQSPRPFAEVRAEVKIAFQQHNRRALYKEIYNTDRVNHWY